MCGDNVRYRLNWWAHLTEVFDSHLPLVPHSRLFAEAAPSSGLLKCRLVRLFRQRTLNRAGVNTAPKGRDCSANRPLRAPELTLGSCSAIKRSLNWRATDFGEAFAGIN